MQGVLWVQVRAALAFELWINCPAAHEHCSPGGLRIPASLRPSRVAYGAFFKEGTMKLAESNEFQQEIRERDQKGDREFI
jgi:hypothetical protein